MMPRNIIVQEGTLKYNKNIGIARMNVNLAVPEQK